MRRMKHTLGRPVFRLAGYLLAITLTSCSSTHVVTAWRDPATSQIMFTKILALVIGGDQASVRAGEDDLCHQVKRVPCKPAYLALPDSMRSDIPAAKALVRKEGFDGALVLRVVSDREKVTYRPPSYGPTFWGYYGYTRAYDPGYYRTDQLVRVETSIYSIAQDKLLWVGTTETVNPKSLSILIEEASKAVREELVLEGAIPAS
jgi:hypothetical protein